MTIMRRFATLISVLLVAVPVVLPAQSGRIPTPESVFGFRPGTDYKLANYDQVLGYFQKVDAASDRVRIVEAGKTTQGRTIYFALVSASENLAKLDRYREIAR